MTSTFIWYTLVGVLTKRQSLDRCPIKSTSLFMDTPRRAHVLNWSNTFFQVTQKDVIAKLEALRNAFSS